MDFAIPRQKGSIVEDLAWKYLKKQGLRLLTRNYQCRLGEIDLIVQDETHLVFVEVRARHSEQYGNALASITRAKCQKIMKTAKHYLMQHPQYCQFPLRFDVIACDGPSAKFSWMKDAFGESY